MPIIVQCTVTIIRVDVFRSYRIRHPGLVKTNDESLTQIMRRWRLYTKYAVPFSVVLDTEAWMWACLS
jgi:hypothetical protein